MRFLAYLLVLAAAGAQAYPTKPVKVIVPFAPGAATDSLARIVSHELQQALGGSFVVDNRAGANGLIAAEAVAKSAPDGYTLFVTTHTTQAANASLYKALPYDPANDFAPVSRLTSSHFVLVVHPALEASNVRELVLQAKARPGKFSYATSNSTSLVSAEWLKALSGIDLVGVPYKANPTAMGDLMSGRIQVMFADQANAVPAIKAGKLKALAVTGAKRALLLPEVPTMQEAGYDGFAINTWAAAYGPAKTPRAVVERLNRAIVAALKKPDIVEKLSGLGYEAHSSTPAELKKFNDEQIELWRRAITAAKITPE